MAQNNSEESKRMAVNDREGLDGILDSLREATERFEQNPESEDLQCEVCLLTRSAYTEFFSVSEWTSTIDEGASRTLRDLFGRILAKLSREGDYFKSVKNRSGEFERFCRELPLRDTADTGVTI